MCNKYSRFASSNVGCDSHNHNYSKARGSCLIQIAGEMASPRIGKGRERWKS
jgi:hypothetical protein